MCRGCILYLLEVEEFHLRLHVNDSVATLIRVEIEFDRHVFAGVIGSDQESDQSAVALK